MDVDAFCNAQIAFVESERKLEAEETQAAASTFSRKELERRGHAVLNLELAGQRTGLGGKTLVELERSKVRVSAADVKFADCLRAGDIVRLEEQPSGSAKKSELAAVAKDGADAVVVRVQDEKITVALDREDDQVPSAQTLWLVKLANSITYDRMIDKLKRMQKKPDDVSTLTRVLLGNSKPSEPVALSEKITFFDVTLNETQRAAVRHALESPEIALIHGPPGTGKTYTIIELIRQLHKLGQRVLVCGPSNVSVDNIVERLGPTGVPMVRIGHPARLLPSVLNHSMDVLSRTSAPGEIVKDIRKELDGNLSKMRTTKGKAKRELYLEVKALRKEYRQREKRCVDEILTSSKVVLTTLHGAGSNMLQREAFDIVIIDEASQALEASCWIPLLTAKKCVLAGDHMQLSPMTRSDKPQRTLFERLLKLHGEGIKRLLQVQYRMHDAICTFPSAELYDGKLVAGPGIGDRRLCDLPGVETNDDTREPIVFIDTQGGDYFESVDDEPSAKRLTESKSNLHEVALVVQHVESLLSSGLPAAEIAVVTPYSAQVAAIRSALTEAAISTDEIEIGTVDGFQGREKEAIVLSLVRSNEKREVGFLAEKRRLNVAMTRPRRHLCVIGDSDTVSRGSPFLKRWMDHLAEHADLRYP